MVGCRFLLNILNDRLFCLWNMRIYSSTLESYWSVPYFCLQAPSINVAWAVMLSWRCMQLKNRCFISCQKHPGWFYVCVFRSVASFTVRISNCLPQETNKFYIPWLPNLSGSFLLKVGQSFGGRTFFCWNCLSLLRLSFLLMGPARWDRSPCLFLFSVNYRASSLLIVLRGQIHCL